MTKIKKTNVNKKEIKSKTKSETNIELECNNIKKEFLDQALKTIKGLNKDFINKNEYYRDLCEDINEILNLTILSDKEYHKILMESHLYVVNHCFKYNKKNEYLLYGDIFEEKWQELSLENIKLMNYGNLKCKDIGFLLDNVYINPMNELDVVNEFLQTLLNKIHNDILLGEVKIKLS